MARNADNINSKSKAHVVREISSTEYEVTSGSSGNKYTVREGAHGMQCDCHYGNPYGSKWGRKQSGCSHVVAVLRVREAEKGRKLGVHASAEAAERQHRPMMEVGQGLHVTSRAA